MNQQLTIKQIIEKCGTVAFKRGETFYRRNQVEVTVSTAGHWEAIVKGQEVFYVTVLLDENGDYLAQCSCPKLASVHQDCQHIAAVLMAIAGEKERQRQQGDQTVITQEFFTLFDGKGERPFAKQRHFETRKLLAAEVSCHAFTRTNEDNVFAMGLTIEGRPVTDLRTFLEELKEGKRVQLADGLWVDLQQHCFDQKISEVLELLLQMTKGTEKKKDVTSNLIMIPPLSWQPLIQLLQETRTARFVVKGTSFKELSVHDGPLPIEFKLIQLESSYRLEVNGVDKIHLFDSYQTAVCLGKLKLLEPEDSKRLGSLLHMFEATGDEPLNIPDDKIEYFKENVLFRLKKLGTVKVAERRQATKRSSSLVAKLYLDRIKNRLLAGLEFHYGHHVIQPLEDRELPADVLLMRDHQKEHQILQLMEEGQFAKTEGGYYLHHEELEFTFLTQVLPKLQKRVQVYATTAVKNRVSTNQFRPQLRVRVKKERTNWLEFKFEMKGISNEEVQDVLQALEEKRKFYRLRNDTLLSLETQEFEDIQKFLLKPQITRSELLDGLDLPLTSSLQLLDSVESEGIFQLEDSLTTFLENLRNPEKLTYEVPAKLDTILRPYQKQGFQWLKTLAEFGFGGILADDMGLGKTLQSIAFILSELKNLRETKRKVLIVSPSSLTYNWLRELQTFAPEINAVVIDGVQKERRRVIKESQDHEVWITSYPLLRRDNALYDKEMFHTVFFDEAQAFKNPLSQTARAVKRVQADHRFALTGTPLENALEELWSIFHVVFPDLLLGLKEFSTMSHKRIIKRIRPFMLRRVKKDVLDELPAKQSTLEAVELLPEQKKLYTAYLAKLRHDTLKHLDRETRHKNRIKILAGITRLRQICCHPGLFVDGYQGRSSKLAQLLKILEEAKHAGRRVLIFSQFTKMLNMIGRELDERGWRFFYLDGQTPNEERVETCQRFNDGERDLFLISLKAGGTGLNLTGADTVILYDTWWNPAVEEQATDRAHRMGQTRVVQVIKLIARGTIEEKMNDLQEKKRELIDEMIDSNVGDPASYLTDDDLKELLSV
ncbi:SNF2 helicase associated domain-containing protein [Pullulanibacillus sp. KACC 23026]|uniref:DEAD/DEAH box helicase n=1 Tax=Pullulanibacillus sp. KACC 23026 TaxID=3028315 RepID=UPI0023B0A9EC|nr:SNF2 helicase associated domain-containing protein [Pullulanibacillus sp. KACC 23026]WEG14401.1 SNF2 helicase associated domain-containing protein [Pullulanibacillus sp. KACC 23026]